MERQMRCNNCGGKTVEGGDETKREIKCIRCGHVVKEKELV